MELNFYYYYSKCLFTFYGISYNIGELRHIRGIGSYHTVTGYFYLNSGNIYMQYFENEGHPLTVFFPVKPGATPRPRTAPEASGPSYPSESPCGSSVGGFDPFGHRLGAGNPSFPRVMFPLSWGLSFRSLIVFLKDVLHLLNQFPC